MSLWKTLFEFIVIAVGIELIWKGYETLIIGEVQVDVFDSIIALVLTFSLMKIRHQRKEKKHYKNLLLRYQKNAMDMKELAEEQNKVIRLFLTADKMNEGEKYES